MNKNLPSKVCIVCNKPFSWRKKWERDWKNVLYCSKKCSKNGLKKNNNNNLILFVTDKLNKEKDKHHAKDDSKKQIRLTRLKRLEKKLKSNILKRKKAVSRNG